MTVYYKDFDLPGCLERHFCAHLQKVSREVVKRDAGEPESELGAHTLSLGLESLQNAFKCRDPILY